MEKRHLQRTRAGQLGAVLDAAGLLPVRFRNQTVGGVILPQNLAAGREEDAADVAVAVILILY